MRKNNDGYINYKVKGPMQIKKSYGIRIVFEYEDGDKLTQQIAGFSDINEAEIEKHKAIAAIEDGTYLVNGSFKLEEFIFVWFESIKPDITYNTFYNYKGVINNHIIPVLGYKRMKDINRADIYKLYNTVFAYSESVAYQVKTIIKNYLDFCVSHKAIKTNYAVDIQMPKNAKKKQYHERTINIEDTLTHEQVLKLLEASKNKDLYLMILLGAVLGLRRSEIIGLKYSDVDFLKRTITVSRQLGRDMDKPKELLPPKTFTKQEIKPKTDSSVRTIELPDIIFNAILEERTKYEKRKSRRKKEFQDDGYLCCSSYGRPRSNNFHYKPYKELLKELNLPDIRWHDLRSTAITQLLLNGVNSKATACFAGHAKENVTVDSYSDNKQLSVVKLRKLDDFIESLELNSEDDTEVKTGIIKIDVETYLPK